MVNELTVQGKANPMQKIAEKVYEIDAGHCLDDLDVDQIRDLILEQNLLILRNDKPPEFFEQFKIYLSGIGKFSLPNYEAITSTSPNFHRINRNDERAFVKGCFHQFSFFPWNQDLFDVFSNFRKQFELKNLLSRHEKDEYFVKYDDNFVARIAAQFYPAGEGFLNLHTDPVDRHQLCVPTLILSQKGHDFFEGGSYFLDKDGDKLFIEDYANVGDTAYFDAGLMHGVDLIDPEVKRPWLDFFGRWMLLFATNKIQSSNVIGNSKDLTKSG